MICVMTKVLARSYVDTKGRKRCVGTPAMKSSQFGPYTCICHMRMITVALVCVTAYVKLISL